MTNNLRIWDAVSKTDPKHTKGFKRAGGFQGTAIKPIWLTKRLTEQFGPAGTGWGMDKPEFQTVPANNEVLVFCTVALWYMDGEKRGTVYGVGGDKVLGTNKYGPFTNDEAFKASYTDALSNAMKQIGMGADIHMGQFEDEKYVRETAREFAASGTTVNGAANGNGAAPQSPSVPEEDRGLLKNPDDPRSTYRVAADDKSPGRTAAELLASLALGVLKSPGASLLAYNDWKAEKCTPKGTKTYGDRLSELHEKHPDLAQKIDEAADLLRVAA